MGPMVSQTITNCYKCNGQGKSIKKESLCIKCKGLKTIIKLKNKYIY